MNVAPRLAITTGDPAGIGPEIILKTLQRQSRGECARDVELFVAGNGEVMRAAAERLGLRIETAAHPTPSSFPLVSMLEAGKLERPCPVGEISAQGGALAYTAIMRAVDGALHGTVDGIVTAPLNKAALHSAGHHYPGHTELLADLTGVQGTVLMLAHGDFRVSHVTAHCALADVPRRVTKERLRRVIELTIEMLTRLGIERPSLGVAGLNPHAGEGGLFGREEIETIAPVIEELRAAGHAVEGPIPGDVVFFRLKAGHFDAAVAMFHDQGHAPTKLLTFGIDGKSGKGSGITGVNITLGLPIIRTSVDHGTAFDIAGRGIADPTSLIDAIDYAARLAAGR